MTLNFAETSVVKSRPSVPHGANLSGISHSFRVLHALHEMRPIATDAARSVVCLCACVLATRMSCAKTAEPTETQFGGGDADSYGSKDHVLDEVQDQTNPFAVTRGDNTAMLKVISRASMGQASRFQDPLANVDNLNLTLQ